MQRAIRVHGAVPVHPGRGEPSRIELRLLLEYIKGEPLAVVVLTEQKALELAEELLRAVRQVRQVRP